MIEDDFRPGVMYIIRTRIGGQKLEREHCMTFLGHDWDDGLVFNARPYAGSQSLTLNMILSAIPVPSTGGRDNPAHYMNKVIHNVG